MTYPEKLLNPQEEVALDLHPHWWFFAKSATTFVAPSILFLYLMGATDGVLHSPVLRWPVGVMAMAGLVWLIWKWLTWKTTYFVITSDRVIYRHGVIGKSGIEIPLERVNNVNFNQRVFERLIGAGDLLIESGGEDGKQRFTDISQPERVQNLIHQQMEMNEQRSRSYIAPMASDIATQLEKLEGLRDRGTISLDDFEEQKRRLLS